MAIFFVSIIAGTIVYYNGIVNEKNSKKDLQNNEITNLTRQVSNLSAEVTNLTYAYPETALGIKELQFTPFNYLYITGYVTNLGTGTAFNVGLEVVAYDAHGILRINMTVPLDSYARFGTDTGTSTFASSNYGNSSLQLGSLEGDRLTQLYRNFS